MEADNSKIIKHDDLNFTRKSSECLNNTVRNSRESLQYDLEIDRQNSDEWDKK